MKLSLKTYKNGVPREVYIPPLVYDILLLPTRKMGKSQGQIKYEKGVIELDNTLHLSRMRLVLWHEILHGIWEMSDLPEGVKFSSPNLPRMELQFTEFSEAVVETLSSRSLEVLRQNPHLRRFLQI